MHASQKVEAPMHVADRVDADAVRSRRVEKVDAQLPHHDHMNRARAVGAEYDLLFDVARP